jgi:hypothetical protein
MQPAMEDPDEPAPEGSGRLVVGGSASPLPIIEGAGALDSLQHRRSCEQVRK